MIFLDKILSIVSKDLKEWRRQPFLILIAIIPLIIISLFVGVFLKQAEILPAGIILVDDDPLAKELRDYMISMKSGTGVPWFEIENNSSATYVLSKFDSGDILGYIIIPYNLSSRLQSGEIVELEVHIHNINDDVTKNVLQRVELACNHINRNLEIGGVVYRSVSFDFNPSTPRDVTFTNYTIAAILALTVILSGSVNMVTATANEFEKATMKELIMGSSSSELLVGKLVTTLVQTAICFILILIFEFMFFQFIPQGNPLLLIFLFIWGVLCFSPIGFLFAARIKLVIPAAIAVLILSVTGWWIGGGLVPAEIWQGWLSILAMIWPGTYFFRSFITVIVTGEIELSLLVFDVIITGLYGIIIFLIATRVFLKEARS